MRLVRKTSAQRSLIRARPVQRLTNDTPFHVKPAGGTCIKQSVELGVTALTNTKPFNRSPAPIETAKQSFLSGLFGPSRSAITSHEAASSTTLPRAIARIAVLVVLDSGLKYVSALRNPLGDLIVIIACRGCPLFDRLGPRAPGQEATFATPYHCFTTGQQNATFSILMHSQRWPETTTHLRTTDQNSLFVSCFSSRLAYL